MAVCQDTSRDTSPDTKLFVPVAANAHTHVDTSGSIQGAMKFGHKRVILLVKIDLKAPLNSGLLGVIDMLALTDLLNLPIQMARDAGLPVKPIPYLVAFPIFEIKDLEVRSKKKGTSKGSNEV